MRRALVLRPTSISKTLIFPVMECKERCTETESLKIVRGGETRSTRGRKMHPISNFSLTQPRHQNNLPTEKRTKHLFSPAILPTVTHANSCSCDLENPTPDNWWASYWLLNHQNRFETQWVGPLARTPRYKHVPPQIARKTKRENACVQPIDARGTNCWRKSRKRSRPTVPTAYVKKCIHRNIYKYIHISLSLDTHTYVYMLKGACFEPHLRDFESTQSNHFGASEGTQTLHPKWACKFPSVLAIAGHGRFWTSDVYAIMRLLSHCFRTEFGASERRPKQRGSSRKAK